VNIYHIFSVKRTIYFIETDGMGIFLVNFPIQIVILQYSAVHGLILSRLFNHMAGKLPGHVAEPIMDRKGSQGSVIIIVHGKEASEDTFRDRNRLEAEGGGDD
jgi:hypothetical protein